MIPLSLYVHIPWCQRKCPYCDFNSHQAKVSVDQQSYIDALLADLALDLKTYAMQLKGRRLSSIFIGGGTPSLFEAGSIAALLAGIDSQMDWEADIEITLEANPGSAEARRFNGFHRAGVNRLSIGAQSFDNHQLKRLGRVHNAKQVIRSVTLAKAAGFRNFNLDLMFGLPDQTTEEAINDLAQALSLNPPHLSCYQLTIEPNTLFHVSPPITPDHETLWQMQSELHQRLRDYGYRGYEVSAFTQGRPCQHNLNYWQFGDYLGIGAGAHGKISNPELGVQRCWKVKHPETYLKRIQSQQDPAGSRLKVSPSDLSFEFMLNALRLSDGFDLDLFSQRTFLPLQHINRQLQRHQQQNLIQISNGMLTPTDRGRNMIDSLLQDYLR